MPLATTPFFSARLFAPALDGFLRAHPGPRVELMEDRATSIFPGGKQTWRTVVAPTGTVARLAANGKSCLRLPFTRRQEDGTGQRNKEKLRLGAPWGQGFQPTRLLLSAPTLAARFHGRVPLAPGLRAEPLSDERKSK